MVQVKLCRRQEPSNAQTMGASCRLDLRLMHRGAMNVTTAGLISHKNEAKLGFGAQAK